MKLWYSSASPFVRKVLVMAHEIGVRDQLELVDASTTAINPNLEIAKDNPLGKIPTLVTDDGMSIFDSSVICEYLDGLHDGDKMIPLSGDDRYNVLVVQAIGDGIKEAAVASRYEQALRPEEKQWDAWVEGQFLKIRNSLDALETWSGARLQDIHLGSISVACALSYLDFRFPDFDWREGHPVLTQLSDTFSKRASMIESDPTQ